MSPDKMKVPNGSEIPSGGVSADEDPIGCCKYVNASGQLVCQDNMKKSECDQIPNSIFIEGGSCD